VLRAAQADVREIRRVESGLRAALDEAHRDGLELNLREIEYSRLNRQRENNAKLYDLVLERTTETDLTRMFQSTHARLLDRALEPGGPISPKFTTNAAGGLGAGLALGLALAFLLSRLDRRLRSVAEVEQTGLTVLGILPKIEEGEEAQPVYGRGKNGRPKRRRRAPAAGVSRDLFVHSHPMSAAAECCRTIRTNLTFMSADDPIRAMVITSASPREGKTTVTTNIAISLAQSGKRVLMVDTDLRRPRIHRAFGVSGARGVTSVIVGEEKLTDVVTSTDIPNLDVLACGPIPPNPSELLHSHRFGELVEAALEHYDRVIFDSPPLGAVTDAAVLAPQLDAALIVVKAQETTRDALASALRQLRDVGAHVVGGVLNDVDPRRKGYAGGDYYYYYRREGYYYAEGDEDDGDEGSPESSSTAAPPPS
jgi:capsular exopolysaccharide synthesis family protein